MKWCALLMIFALSGCYFYPEKHYPVLPSALGLEYETVQLVEEGEPTLECWLLKADAEESRGLVLFFHGNAQNISYHLPSVSWLPAKGFDVFMLGYRGYGGSEGEPSREGLVRDGKRAVQYVRNKDLEGPLYFFGQSLGGTIGLVVISDLPPGEPFDAAVIEAPFSSYRRIAQDKLAETGLLGYLFWPLTWFISERYSPERIDDPVRVPIWLVHGSADRVVPAYHLEKLKPLSSPNSKSSVIPNLGHIQVFQDEERRAEMVQFYTKKR